MAMDYNDDEQKTDTYSPGPGPMGTSISELSFEIII